MPARCRIDLVGARSRRQPHLAVPVGQPCRHGVKSNVKGFRNVGRPGIIDAAVRAVASLRFLTDRTNEKAP